MPWPPVGASGHVTYCLGTKDVKNLQDAAEPGTRGTAHRNDTIEVRVDELSREVRDRIVARWTECVLRTYSRETARFLEKERDPFANPVGAALRTSLGPLFDAMLRGDPAERMVENLDQLIQIRCVQDFSPSRAIAFLFDLKAVVREQVADPGGEGGGRGLVEAIDRQVDTLVLHVFDRFVKYRDRIWEVRIGEVKRRVATLVRMSGLSEHDLDPVAGSKDTTV